MCGHLFAYACICLKHFVFISLFDSVRVHLTVAYMITSGGSSIEGHGLYIFYFYILIYKTPFYKQTICVCLLRYLSYSCWLAISLLFIYVCVSPPLLNSFFFLALTGAGRHMVHTQRVHDPPYSQPKVNLSHGRKTIIKSLIFPKF